MTIQELQGKIETSNVEEFKTLSAEYKKILTGLQTKNDDYVHFFQEYVTDINDLSATDSTTLVQNKQTLTWLTDTLLDIKARLTLQHT